MMRIRRVLFPVDFRSACTSPVADAVHAVVSRTGASLVLLHTSAGEGEGLRFRQFRKELWDAASTVYRTDAGGDGEDAILDAIEREEPDLVMLATAGRGDFRRTRRILHGCRCPVWTCGRRPYRGGMSWDTCDCVYCAVSLRNLTHDRELLDWAAGYAKLWNARLTVAHGVAGAVTSGGAQDPFSLSLQRWAASRVSDLEETAGIRCPMSVGAGTAAGWLLQTVEEPRCSVVVAGRPKAFAGFDCASPLHRILRLSPSPVIVV